MTKRVILAWAALALMATGAVAQTVTGSGTTKTVGNSPISVSGSSVGIGTSSRSTSFGHRPFTASPEA